MRAFVIGNDGDSDPGFAGHWALDRGFVLETLLRESPHAWPALDGVDLVVSLGSEWSVYWSDVAPSVDAELALLAAARRRAVPVIGLCFGSQLLARLLGAQVAKAAAAEIGWYDIEPTAAGAALIAPGPWFEWHYDRWQLPMGAELLAANDQAFRLERMFATQFHPEVTVEMVASWSGSSTGVAELTRLGIDRDELLARTVAETVHTEADAYGLFDRALAAVTSA